MKKELAKCFVYGAAFLLTLFLVRVLAPLFPPSDSLGRIEIWGLSIYLLDVLAWASFSAFFIIINLIFTKIIDQKMK